MSVHTDDCNTLVFWNNGLNFRRHASARTPKTLNISSKIASRVHPLFFFNKESVVRKLIYSHYIVDFRRNWKHWETGFQVCYVSYHITSSLYRPPHSTSLALHLASCPRKENNLHHNKYPLFYDLYFLFTNHKTIYVYHMQHMKLNYATAFR